jgi:hypothetical protein
VAAPGRSDRLPALTLLADQRAAELDAELGRDEQARGAARQRGSPPAALTAAAAVPSVEPSSSTNTSRSG